jgi:hypothetical protein
MASLIPKMDNTVYQRPAATAPRIGVQVSRIATSAYATT